MVKKKRPTLQDIADRVGATKMTVSRCLRGGNNVSEHMRERIFAEAERWVTSRTGRRICFPNPPATQSVCCCHR
ncbi:LacI family DNA-binding transcriptional regulator [Marinobacter manganoxydans]|uniref:LacI family DNA-binding transcriptional regulator n=1 Tax=Marinobacter manganoxydans TaxID=1150997 RepID=UPI001D0D05C8